MKKLVLLLVMCTFAAAAVAQQSLGDIARARRAEKSSLPPTRQFNDDTISRRSVPATISERAAVKMEEEATAAKEAEVRQAQKDAEEAQKRWNEHLKKMIESQEQEIAILQRELNVTQREAELLTAAYYGDAGVMLRDPEQYLAASRALLEEISYKKYELAAAQQKLADLQEQERKDRAGLLFASAPPRSVGESARLRKANEPQLAKQSKLEGKPSVAK